MPWPTKNNIELAPDNCWSIKTKLKSGAVAQRLNSVHPKNQSFRLIRYKIQFASGPTARKQTSVVQVPRSSHGLEMVHY